MSFFSNDNPRIAGKLKLVLPIVHGNKCFSCCLTLFEIEIEISLSSFEFVKKNEIL